MQEDYGVLADEMQAAPQMAAHLRQRLQQFVAPLLLTLDARIDALLVGTFLRMLEVLVCFRNRAHALLLSEVGAYVLSSSQAPAGIKRLSNLLRCPKWQGSDYTLFVVAGESRLNQVVSRPGNGLAPLYLLTNEPIAKAADAWKVIFAYAHRWQIEMAFRYNKSELALQSPRLWTWERHVKLMLMVTLCYAFLLTLLPDVCELLRQWLLRYFCHRTGKRSQETQLRCIGSERR